MLAWNPRPYGDGMMAVINHPDERHWTRHLQLSDTTGACWSSWSGATNHRRLLQIFIESWHIVCRDGLDPKMVHEALLVIPEYRATMSGEEFFWIGAVKTQESPSK